MRRSSSECDRSCVRCLQLLEQPSVLDRDHAWSAKVCTSSICFVGKRPDALARQAAITPIGSPSRIIGTPRAVGSRPVRCASRNVYSGSTAHREFGPIRRSRATRGRRPCRDPAATGLLCRKSDEAYEKPNSAAPPDKTPILAARSMPSRHRTIALPIPTSVCRTGCKSKAERLMTLSTSAVAVCCCSDLPDRRCVRAIP